ncbi:ankyrin repeat-containing protein At5g02620-like [Cornus florida]|uniref:ankyrin repeat-containing protein At5g02620-like n=1 Tax=Cornus florida TaxID=4283 RepID=UPI00289C6F43|nr:ankyrin repeat-containing protein At5g02620-like [Cornus florida]XP_059667774.1 ankyrin repeat-containing protein At5g02620-like [Cornus florida]
MEAPARQQSFRRKKIVKQLTGKRDDTPLHSAARAGNLEVALEILTNSGEEELKELLSKQNRSGETALYVAAEYGYVDLVKEMIQFHDIGSAGIKATNHYDAFHIAAKQGDLEILKVLMEAFHELSMTSDQTNTTALHTAATQGHVEVVNFLLEKNSNLATIAKSNSKTALHSSARNGHLDVVRALLSKELGIATRIDRKGQTALHMAVKGQSIEVVDELIESDAALINMVDSKGNTALHIAARKGRAPIVRALLTHNGINKEAINKSGETALDTAEKTGHPEVATILQEHGVQSAKSLKPQPTNPARELKQTVSDIKHEVHNQLEHTRRTRKSVRGIAKQVNKMHEEGLNNAITSTTVVSVLIATVTFAAIFTVPGQYVDDPNNVPPGLSVGEANIAPNPSFMVFFISDSLALFISLAVVVVQTSVVAVERKAKKQMMAVINKLMWLACVFVAVAFLSLSYIIVGGHEKWLAVGVTVIGTVILVTTLGILCYWVIMHRIEDSNLSRIRRSARSSKSQSGSMSVRSESEVENDYKKFYAI